MKSDRSHAQEAPVQDCGSGKVSTISLFVLAMPGKSMYFESLATKFTFEQCLHQLLYSSIASDCSTRNLWRPENASGPSSLVARWGGEEQGSVRVPEVGLYATCKAPPALPAMPRSPDHMKTTCFTAMRNPPQWTPTKDQPSTLLDPKNDQPCTYCTHTSKPAQARDPERRCV